MGKGRLEAFSDGVIAIIITIMVLEIRVPHGDELHELIPLIPVIISYILSFVHVGIYWNNHHHMMHAVQHVNGRVLWANMHLLFWLSLMPFATAWMGENHFALWPTMVYGCVLLLSGAAYFILSQELVRLHGKNSDFGMAIGRDRKGMLSVILYLSGILLCFITPWIGLALYASVAAIWLIPDRRFEKKLQ